MSTVADKRKDAESVAAELVKASVQGRLKRKRTYDFERDKLARDLERLWTEAKKSFVKDGVMHGTSTHAFQYVPNFREFEATKEEVENALPEQLKEIAKLDGFNLLVKKGDLSGFAVVLEYFRPVDSAVEERKARGDWE